MFLFGLLNFCMNNCLDACETETDKQEEHFIFLLYIIIIIIIIITM